MGNSEKTESQVAENLLSLNICIEDATAILRTLHSRLGPVLRGETPSPLGDNSTKSVSQPLVPLVPLAQDVRSARDKVCEINLLVASILNRLEL